ncbi:hypothetical protein NDU88_008385 [Pleurodeles waltl]|uniref:Uncharacterized protein n=1 Tax=Pleurodeles waltl TaxID=8319 RepID=A0AAV7SV51_PLEWA|nr:hypothetical protein NDU88_008385 [Pleurodeles waltl]
MSGWPVPSGSAPRALARKFCKSQPLFQSQAGEGAGRARAILDAHLSFHPFFVVLDKGRLLSACHDSFAALGSVITRCGISRMSHKRVTPQSRNDSRACYTPPTEARRQSRQNADTTRCTEVSLLPSWRSRSADAVLRPRPPRLRTLKSEDAPASGENNGGEASPPLHCPGHAVA